MLLLILVGIVIVIYMTSRGSSSTVAPPSQDLNQQWVDFVAAYRAIAKNKSEKAMVDRMLADLMTQGMPAPTLPGGTAVAAVDTEEYEKHVAQGSPVTSETQPATVAALETAQSASVQAVPDWNGYPENPPPAREPVQLDNITLLLYFGAFLFLASAGLFVALTGAYGPLRVFTVLAVMAALYFGGFWLHDNKPKLQQAGYTFIGMGMMLAPLAGLATYSYVMRSQPHLVWFMTSVLCLALYGHALRKLKTTLMEYIFIGTFVSLFESGVSVLQLPLYYYGWGFAAVGLLLNAWQLYRGQPVEEGVEDSPPALSAGVLMPLSVMTALYMVPKYGVLQLGVSLTLMAVYFALQAWQAKTEEARVNSAMIAHSTALAALGSFSYAINHAFPDVALVLLVAGLAQLVFILMRKQTAMLRASASVLVMSLILAVFLAWAEPWLVVATTVGLFACSIALWVRQKRPALYIVGMLAVLMLPYIFGWYVVVPHWQAAYIALAAFGASMVPLVSFVLVRQSQLNTSEWREGWRTVQVLAMLAGLTATIFSGHGAHVLIASTAVAGLAYVLARMDESSTGWLQLSSVLTVVPILCTGSEHALWLVGILIAFLWNLTLTFVARLELARWVGSLAWALLPVAIIRQHAALDSAEAYAAAYFICAAGFVLARAIAQKRISRLPVTLAELETRLRSDSMAYVFGYGLAAFVAYTASLFAAAWLPAVIGTGLAGLFAYIAIKVEKAPSLMIMVPILLQAALWGTYPDASSVTGYVLMSSFIGIGAYASGSLIVPDRLGYGRYIQAASALTLYAAPGAALVLQQVWAMPLALLVAGAVTLHAAWGRVQSDREWAGGVMVLAVMWLMQYNGVTNIQAYTHLLAAVFGAYAYWRSFRGDATASDQYLQAMLVSATIPLALQVIAGNAGGLYGWWFLGEQIAIMLLGMTIRKRFVTRWGMYVAVGAVLYQLRSLAWLSLTLLALFLISLAVYQLQKSDDKTSKNQ